MKMEELKLNSSVAGKYKLTVRKPDGEVRLETGWFDNLITNKGLDNYFTGGVVMNYCHVGSGTSTPTVTQTTLDSRIMSTSTRSSSTQSANGSAPYESTSVATYRFAAVGGATNISEIGVSPDSLGTSLTSRALILDVSGSPITISLNTGEVLDATYALSVYPALIAGDYSHTAVVSGNTHTFTWRAATVGNPRYWNPEGGIGATAMASSVSNTGVQAITSIPYVNQVSQATLSSYTTGTFFLTMSYFYDLTAANFSNGINAIGIAGGAGFSTPSLFSYQCGVSPAILKLPTQTLSFTINISVSRY
jgi:hypothetical protein